MTDDKFVIFVNKRGKSKYIYWIAETYDSTFLDNMPEDVRKFEIGDKRKLTSGEILKFTKQVSKMDSSELNGNNPLMLLRDIYKGRTFWIMRTFVSDEEEKHGSVTNP